MYLTVKPGHLPALPEMRWVVWREEIQGGRAVKVPYVPSAPSRRASVANADTWGTLFETLAAYHAHSFNGIAFVLNGCGLVGIDLDDCRDPETETIEPWALSYINKFGTYTEVSPSGTGVHLVLRTTTFPQGGHKRGYEQGSIEIYWNWRMITLTGHAIRDLSIMDRTDEFLSWHQALFPADWNRPPHSVASHGRETPVGGPVIPQASTKTSRTPVLGPGELGVLKRTRTNAGFSKLLAGDISAYPSPSEADQAFIMHLLRNGATEHRADLLLRNSPLFRPK